MSNSASNVGGSRLGQIIARNEATILEDWLRAQRVARGRRTDLISDDELREQSREFLSLVRDAASQNVNADSSEWDAVRDFLDTLTRGRTVRGFSTAETATFVFSLKQPLFTRLRADLASEPASFADELWTVTTVFDALGIYTTEVYQRSREEIINRQQTEMLELSTPVVKLWDGVLALPMIGTLDSGRTQVVMESLLQRIVDTGAEIAILDITGVPTVDTLVAQHLLKTVTAARLMGADCIISGIRPQIAQTIVHLGVDLQDVITKASLADAFALAMQRRGLRVVRTGTGTAGSLRAGPPPSTLGR